MSIYVEDDEMIDTEASTAEVKNLRDLYGMPAIQNEEEGDEGSHDQEDEPLDSRAKLARLLDIAPKPKAKRKAVAEVLAGKDKATFLSSSINDVLKDGNEALLDTETPRLTDNGMANYVKDELGEKVAFCLEQELFVLYDEKKQRWLKDQKRHALRIAIRRILHGLPQKLNFDEKARAKTYERIESSSVPSSVAREMELIVQERFIDEFDDNDYLLGVENGIIELGTGVFRPARASDLITKTAAVAYDPKARCPEFERFVYEIMCGKPDLIDYLQTMIGYFLLGDNPENIFLFLQGRGANGKTVLLNVIESLMGEYCNAIPMTVLIRTQRETVGDDILSIVGYRVLMCRELEKDDKMNAAKIKRLVGNDSESARPLYGDHRRVKVKGKPVIATNEIPRIEDRSNGIWRRIKLIPFLRVFKEEEQIKRYEDILLKEKPGILNWALDGFKKYHSHGFIEPEICRQYLDNLRGEVNPVEEFLSEFYDTSNTEKVAARSLHTHYLAWVEKTPHAPHLSEKRFASELRSLGIQRYRPQGTVYGLKPKSVPLQLGEGPER